MKINSVIDAIAHLLPDKTWPLHAVPLSFWCTCIYGYALSDQQKLIIKFNEEKQAVQRRWRRQRRQQQQQRNT